MKIAVVFNAHENTELVSDTIEAVRAWVTDKILVVVDGAFWDSWGQTAEINAYKTCGFIHAQPRAPYKNVAYGLMTTYKLWPDMDWYCYIEPDTLFCNSEFREDLLRAERDNAWMVGTNLRHGDYKFPFLERMLRVKLNCSKYFLGCCVFSHQKFLRKLNEIQFFDKFLFWTNEFICPYFPDYGEQGGYDFSEHLYPTLAHYLGGKLYPLSSWSDQFGDWASGNFKKYPIRWQPDIIENYFYPDVSIAHPVKDIYHPYRLLNKRRRRNVHLSSS